MNRFINRLYAAFYVLFKKNVIVLTVYEVEPCYATLWSSVDDDNEFISTILIQTANFIAPKPTETVIFEEQKN